ncbi:substrate-binding domain-containing protein [Pseudoxanthomonas indica]|uniref:Phosphate ABC transporter substrate-binding protein, PhoT family n=1 Tax=Pseudoxanthomonas indica TaxID=428993 RepID=A0A1T5J5U3_9GAMM|nr:substrate-binding domain-containing protein [Pseudoxanthomonas indica]GGD56569.1 hypothetical protein GCM10007235_31200 [Pseudoxanthomonas indica]SKC46759.1 phosphate ABC transporter substrate-binding protein, PhoT family [Pseudoxanthomonas indica]
MYQFCLRAAFAACLVLFAILPAHAQEDAERLRIHGSNTVGQVLLPAMVETWLHDIGYLQIRRKSLGAQRLEIHAVRDGMPLIVEIDRRGSAQGFQALVDGEAEIAMMTREPSAAERDAGWQLGDLQSPDQEFVVALDGLAVVVHRDNPVQGLSVAQLRDVLAGRITDWSQLGGRKAPIQLHLGAEPSGNRDFLKERVMAGTPILGSASTAATLAQAARAVAHEAGGLAVVGVMTAIPAGVRTLAVSDGGIAVLPTRLNVLSEDYPLVRRYRLYGGQLMSALGRSFAQYSITRRAQLAAERAGFLAVTLRPASQATPPDVARPYGAAVAGAERLPLSLRFTPASLTTFFDSRSFNDLDRVVAYLKLPQNRERHATVVGFANQDGSNRLITTVRSNERADAVAEYLVKQGIPVQRSVGVGAMRSLSGGGGEAARFRNERMEVWVR